jgi:hypothetical protein
MNKTNKIFLFLFFLAELNKFTSWSTGRNGGRYHEQGTTAKGLQCDIVPSWFFPNT